MKYKFHIIKSLMFLPWIFVTPVSLSEVNVLTTWSVSILPSGASLVIILNIQNFLFKLSGHVRTSRLDILEHAGEVPAKGSEVLSWEGSSYVGVVSETETC